MLGLVSGWGWYIMAMVNVIGHLYSAVAQLVERLAVNEDVLGSSPSRGARVDR